MVDFSLAIPTYNGADRLPQVLDRLRTQANTQHFTWEIIVVDNNSQDHTASLIRHYQENWPPEIPLHYVLESEQGAAFARARAIEVANGSLIGFLDDDNLPDCNWVAAAYEFGINHPQVGAYGSKIQGLFAVEPPKNFHKIAAYFAIIDRGSVASYYEPQRRMLPPGAGLVVRKQAWQENVPKRLILNHKGKEAGLASEDLEALLYIQNAGWEIWYNPEMLVEHDIPGWRFEKDYLMSMARCIGFSRHHLRMLRLKPWQRPLFVPVYVVNDLRRLALYWLQFRHQISEDVVSAYELKLLWSSLLSPFFLSKRQVGEVIETLQLKLGNLSYWLKKNRSAKVTGL